MGECWHGQPSTIVGPTALDVGPIGSGLGKGGDLVLGHRGSAASSKSGPGTTAFKFICWGGGAEASTVSRQRDIGLGRSAGKDIERGIDGDLKMTTLG